MFHLISTSLQSCSDLHYEHVTSNACIAEIGKILERSVEYPTFYKQKYSAHMWALFKGVPCRFPMYMQVCFYILENVIFKMLIFFCFSVAAARRNLVATGTKHRQTQLSLTGKIYFAICSAINAAFWTFKMWTWHLNKIPGKMIERCFLYCSKKLGFMGPFVRIETLGFDVTFAYRKKNWLESIKK